MTFILTLQHENSNTMILVEFFFLLYLALFSLESSKVHIFWEGHKFLQNLHRRFVLCSNGQIYGGDFRKILWPSQNKWTLNYKYSFRENFDNFRRKLTELTLHFSDKSNFFVEQFWCFFALFKVHLIFYTNPPSICKIK